MKYSDEIIDSLNLIWNDRMHFSVELHSEWTFVLVNWLQIFDVFCVLHVCWSFRGGYFFVYLLTNVCSTEKNMFSQSFRITRKSWGNVSSLLVARGSRTSAHKVSSKSPVSKGVNKIKLAEANGLNCIEFVK